MKLASTRDKTPLGNPRDTHHCGGLIHRRCLFIFHRKSPIGWTMLLFLLSVLPIYSPFVTQVPQRASRLGQCSLAYRGTDTPSNGSKILRRRFEMTTTTTSEGQTEQAQALKRTIIENAADTSNGLEATKDQRDVIAKAINELVAFNPTEDITTSDLATGKKGYLGLHFGLEMTSVGSGFLQDSEDRAACSIEDPENSAIRIPQIIGISIYLGTWNLVYTTTKGASGGKLGPFVGSVQQEVDIAGGVYINYVRVGPLTGKLDATWEVLNKKQWKVIFKTIQFSLWGQQLIRRDLAQEGIWTLSYLDKDFRVLTARSMERDTGNLYVLGRT